MLVTCADGFVGSHQEEILVREGVEIHTLLLLKSVRTRGKFNLIDTVVRVGFKSFLTTSTIPTEFARRRYYTEPDLAYNYSVPQ